MCPDYHPLGEIEELDYIITLHEEAMYVQHYRSTEIRSDHQKIKYLEKVFTKLLQSIFYESWITSKLVQLYSGGMFLYIDFLSATPELHKYGRVQQKTKHD